MKVKIKCYVVRWLTNDDILLKCECCKHYWITPTISNIGPTFIVPVELVDNIDAYN